MVGNKDADTVFEPVSITGVEHSIVAQEKQDDLNSMTAEQLCERYEALGGDQQKAKVPHYLAS